MAGGSFNGKINPKKFAALQNGNSNEILKDSAKGDQAPKKFSLSGLLGLNQTVELHPESKSQNWSQEFFSNINFLQQQEKSLADQKQKELEKTVAELQTEVANLAKSTDNLENNLTNITLENIPEASDYQINFLRRIKNYIINFRKNICEASSWLQSFNTKKRKRNFYWNTVKNQKKGGGQYLMSNEHSAARAAN